MGDFWQNTAQMFGSLFEKPKMTEKLLLKPPFKYLFDIVIATIKATGFGNGLYSDEELSGDFYDTKEKKILFLNKIISLVTVMLKEDIDVKPNKIVAGIEPEKTNEFLQAMYRAAVSGEESGPYVKKVLKKFAGEGGAAEEERAPPKEEAKQEKPKSKPREEPKQEKPREEPKQEKPKKPVEEPKVEKQKEPEKPAPAKIERPTSAAKRPPKETSNVKVVEDTRKKEGTSGIIRDEDGQKEDDDNFMESKPQESKSIGKVDTEKHGKFVKEALSGVQNEEVQKEEAVPKTTGVRMGKIGAGRSKPTAGGDAAVTKKAAAAEDLGTDSMAGGAGGSSQNEVEMVQKLIQGLTQNINPLRKSIDFINDDIESMNKEMEYWRSQYLGSKAKYQLELSQTEEQLQPLQNKLAELEEQIKDRKFKIQAAKSQTLQNEQKIQKLLYAVVSNK